MRGAWLEWGHHAAVHSHTLTAAHHVGGHWALLPVIAFPEFIAVPTNDGEWMRYLLGTAHGMA